MTFSPGTALAINKAAETTPVDDGNHAAPLPTPAPTPAATPVATPAPTATPLPVVATPTPVATPAPTATPVAPPVTYKTRTDSKTMPALAKVDILLVVDFTKSMYQDLGQLSNKLAGLSDQLSNFDWQIAVTGSGMGASSFMNPYDQHGTLLPFLRDYYFYPELKTSFFSTDDNFDYFFYYTLTNPQPQICPNGWCQVSNPEGMKASIAAINLHASSDSGFFREGSVFVPVIISNSDENYAGGATQGAAVAAAYQAQLANSMAGLLPMNIGVLPGDSACLSSQQDMNVQTVFGHAQAANDTTSFVQSAGGVSQSICASSYTPMFAKLDSAIRKQASFIDLSELPISAPIVTLTPASSIAWSLSGQRITFASALPKGTVVSVSYEVAN